MIFWGCSVSYPEGHKVSEALRESTYPFLAVIVLRQNRMVVVGRREGSIEPTPLIDWLEHTIREYEAFIVAARADRDTRNFNREIRSEQEAAFAETLRQDQEREEQRLEEERRKQEEEDERKRLEEDEKRKLNEEHERKMRIQRMKIDLAEEIPEEPDKQCPESIRILIKLPGGQRLERRYVRDSIHLSILESDIQAFIQNRNRIRIPNTYPHPRTQLIRIRINIPGYKDRKINVCS